MPKNYRVVAKGAAVRRARVAQNITEADLANLVKVSRQTISRIENGKGASADLAHRLAAKLGRSFEELFEVIELRGNGDNLGE